MAKEHWIKKGMYIAVTTGALVGMVYGAFGIFAKTKTVNLMDKRLELAIEDDKVHRAESEVDWIEQRTIFERRKEPQTITEQEVIERAKRKVEEFKKTREQKQQAYEAAK